MKDLKYPSTPQQEHSVMENEVIYSIESFIDQGDTQSAIDLAVDQAVSHILNCNTSSEYHVKLTLSNVLGLLRALK